MCSEELSSPSLGYEIAFFRTSELTSDTYLRVGGIAISLFMDDTIWCRFLQNLDSGKKRGKSYISIYIQYVARARFYSYIRNFCQIVKNIFLYSLRI